ncbi:MAG: protein jag [Thermoanaerobacteraceae bacterium]|nr:protein jag [Thermoanaerobacteraceae bacterium]
MRSVIKTAKTVDEAVAEALRELNVDRERAKVEVLEEPQKGLFGLIGNRLARVKVTVSEDPVKLAKEFLYKVCDEMGVNVYIEDMTVDEYIHLSFSGKDLGILIGRRGETLDALQYLTNLVVNKQVEDRVKFILDVQGYRKRREETLRKLAQRLSDKVKRTGNKIVLEPMNPHERRVIHTALQKDNRVNTYSEGEEPYRKVVIAPKNS